MVKVLDWGGDENEFINSGYYTDKSLGAYFKEARKQKWYDNTLFILVADHSHNSYRNWPLQSFEYHKIPLLLYGNVIKEEFKGTTWDKLASNTDITSTLLSQMNISHKHFPWSRDLFNPYSPECAFFELNDGFGWKTLKGEFVYNSIIDHYYVRNTPESGEEEFINKGKAYLQAMFQEFMDL